MDALSQSDFAQLLDELMRASSGEETPGPRRPTVPFDFVVAGKADDQVSRSDAQAEYFDALEALDRLRDAPSLEGPEPDVPPIEPEQIAGELALERCRNLRDLDAARREFAFRNHPDRVGAELRERAIIRMQIANRLIDDAKRSLAAIGS